MCATGRAQARALKQKHCNCCYSHSAKTVALLTTLVVHFYYRTTTTSTTTTVLLGLALAEAKLLLTAATTKATATRNFSKLQAPTSTPSTGSTTVHSPTCG